MRCSPTSEHKLSEKDRDRSSRSGPREILYFQLCCVNAMWQAVQARERTDVRLSSLRSTAPCTLLEH